MKQLYRVAVISVVLLGCLFLNALAKESKQRNTGVFNQSFIKQVTKEI